MAFGMFGFSWRKGSGGGGLLGGVLVIMHAIDGGDCRRIL